MLVEVTHTEPTPEIKQEQEKYPCLKISKNNGIVVLFINDEFGVCVKANKESINNELKKMADKIDSDIEMPTFIKQIFKRANSERAGFLGEFSGSWKKEAFKKLEEKITLSNEDFGEGNYPKLKFFPKTEAIVLFTDEDEGICLKDGNRARTGEYSEDWAESVFEVFTGKITLAND